MEIVKGFGPTGNQVTSVTPDPIGPSDYNLLPFYGKVSAVCRTKAEAGDLVRWFGHEDFMPFLPVLLCIPGGWGQLCGLGLSTASELSDEAVARWEIQETRIAKTGKTFDFDEAREKAGLMRREDVDNAMREALLARNAAYRSSPITDPVPNREYPNPTRKTVFAEQPSNETWTERKERGFNKNPGVVVHPERKLVQGTPLEKKEPENK